MNRLARLLVCVVLVLVVWSASPRDAYACPS